MEFVKVMEIYNRMCKEYDCPNCPLEKLANNKGEACYNFIKHHPRQTEECLVEWDKEHPAKTFATDFFEKYPNALKDEFGFPKACPRGLGYIKFCPNYPALTAAQGCRECWNQPMKE